MRKYKFTTNLGLKIMALIFSAFLWLIVVKLDNPVSSQVFTDIPVTIVNDDIITSAGEVYQVVGDQNVNVVVYANRQVRESLDKEDIIATADISEMDTDLNLVPIKITIPEYSGKYESAYAVSPNLQIKREKSSKKVLTLTIHVDGQPEDGYMLGDMSANPDKVTITGAESALEMIDRADAQIDVSGIASSCKLKATLNLYDANGNPQNMTQIGTNLGEGGITVSVEVLKKKTIPIEFEVSGTPADGYKYTGCTSEPERIQICGSSEAVDSVSEIKVPSSAIKIDGASENIETTIDISQYLPENVGLVDESSANVAVTVSIEAEGTRTIDFLVSSIRIDNLKENLQVSYEPDAEIRFYVSGDEKQLQTLDISNAVSVNLKGYSEPGTYELPVKVDLPDGISLTQDVTVELTLQEKPEEDSTADQSSEESQ